MEVAKLFVQSISQTTSPDFLIHYACESRQRNRFTCFLQHLKHWQYIWCLRKYRVEELSHLFVMVDNSRVWRTTNLHHNVVWIMDLHSRWFATCSPEQISFYWPFFSPCNHAICWLCQTCFWWPWPTVRNYASVEGTKGFLTAKRCTP